MPKQKQTPQTIRWINAWALIIMATLIIFALRPWGAWHNPDPNYYGWNLFSYFTTQSNLIAAVTYVIAAIALLRRTALSGWFRYLRGAATLYMLITGIVYTFLLAQYTVTNTWSNIVLHQFGPLFIIVWWLVWPSRKPISIRGANVWLIFPGAWLIYTFIRAAFTHWYPYPFLDPTHVGGKINVALYVLGIAAGFVVISQSLAWLSRVRASDNSLY